MQMEGSYVASVVITGLVIVFLALVILIVSVLIFGKIFESIGEAQKKKQASAVTKAPEADKVVAAPAVPAVPAEDRPAAEDGISDEVIAVIAAAVAAMGEESGKKFAVRSVKRASSRRGAWGNAALSESTRSL